MARGLLPGDGFFVIFAFFAVKRGRYQPQRSQRTQRRRDAAYGYQHSETHPRKSGAILIISWWRASSPTAGGLPGQARRRCLQPQALAHPDKATLLKALRLPRRPMTHISLPPPMRACLPPPRRPLRCRSPPLRACLTLFLGLQPSFGTTIPMRSTVVRRTTASTPSVACHLVPSVARFPPYAYPATLSCR